ncbi:hypothetical protein VARIO8X_60116 [Burkholderiales bacterium 8X]|nr:hypothetical protein VARIO8X_60116 [Burkholderiales bacterium 8X]
MESAGRPAARPGSRPQALALAAALHRSGRGTWLAAALPRLRPLGPVCAEPWAAGRRAAGRPRLHDRRRARLAAVVAAVARHARQPAAPGHPSVGRGFASAEGPEVHDVASDASGHRGLTSKA